MDTERIDRVINKLRMLWQTYPNLRLGQLIVNASIPDSDLFYLDDAKLEERIDYLLSRGFTSEFLEIAPLYANKK